MKHKSPLERDRDYHLWLKHAETGRRYYDAWRTRGPAWVFLRYQNQLNWIRRALDLPQRQ
jgi:hypothetical protein